MVMTEMVWIHMVLMGNLCNQTPTLSNTAEMAEIKKSFRTTPLRLNKERFLGWSKITNC
jgi:hypothetical protein